jgi:hypothetical protein
MSRGFWQEESGRRTRAFLVLLFPVALDRLPVQLPDQIRLVLVHEGAADEYTRGPSRDAAPFKGSGLRASASGSPGLAEYR